MLMSLLEYITINKKYSHLILEWDISNGSMENYMPHSRKYIKWN